MAISAVNIVDVGCHLLVVGRMRRRVLLLDKQMYTIVNSALRNLRDTVKLLLLYSAPRELVVTWSANMSPPVVT